MKRTLCTIVFLSVVIGLYAQQSEVVINTVGGQNYPNEPSIAISRTDPKAIIVCANIDNQYNSIDGGKSWKHKQIKTVHGMYGDPVLHASKDGSIFLTHLSKTRDADPKRNYSFIDRIVVQKTDSSLQFNDGSYMGHNGQKMQDKPWMSEDFYSSNARNLYVTWTEFDKIGSKKKKHKSRIQFSASEDRGETWRGAITVSDGTGDCVDDDETLEGATTAIGPMGQLYCVWAGHNKIYFDQSLDAGKTWGVDRVIGDQQSGWSMDIPHVYRTNGMPFILCDLSEGENHGRIYVVYGDTLFGDADIFMLYSDDDGGSWSKPVRVNQDIISNGKSQYMPNMAIDDLGNLVIVYYDRRNSTTNTFSDVYAARTNDGGKTFKEVKLNSLITAPHGKGTFSGDYIDVDISEGNFAAVWATFDDHQKIMARIGSMDSVFKSNAQIVPNQMAYHITQEWKKQEIYLRFNQPVQIHHTYSYTKWFGLYKKTGEIRENLACKTDGTQTIDYVVQYQRGRHFEQELIVMNGDRLVLKVTSKRN